MELKNIFFDADLQLLAVADSLNDNIILVNSRGMITGWNKTAEITFGYTKEELLGKPIEVLIPPDRSAEAKELQQRVRRNETIHSFETESLAKNGIRLSFALSLFPVTNDKGEITGTFCIGKDLGERRRREEKNAVLASIVNSSDDAIISKNLNGYITSWNAAAERIFGYTEKEAIGQHITMIIPPRLRDEENMIIGKIKKGFRLEHFETRRVRKDGSELDLSITVSPLKNERGVIIGASKIGRDITETIKTRRQLERYTEELKRLNRYKDDFISVASHELNTPLTSLKGYLDMLVLVARGEAGLLEPELANSFAQKAVGMSNKLAKLVKDLLDVSRIESGNLRLQKSRWDCLLSLHDVIDSLRITSRRHHLFYEATDGPLFVNADKDRLEQVFFNIISNAIKYSPNAGKVMITAKKKDGFAVIAVRDFGIGIPKSQQEKIFTRFYRAESAAATFSGLGIGLYVTHEIVAAHGGKIEFVSDEGEGSVFTVLLPLVNEEINS